MSAGCYLYFSIGNLAPIVYNGKIFKVSDEDILTNATKLKIYCNIS